MPEDVQTGCGVHPVFCTACSGMFFSGVKQQSRITDNPPPSSAEVRNEWRCGPTSICPHGVDRETKAVPLVRKYAII